MQVTDAMVAKALDAYNEALSELTEKSPEVPTSLDDIREAGLRAALTAALAEMWRPIEEAPNGARLLVYVPRYGAMSGHFDGRWHCHGCLNRDAEPTHFMPLPAPPRGK